ncbi:aminotransferase class V-fold PLP-dependent enzyme [Actinokineospora spheciospongiae]|uniref:aminotransferase class V-fold PLP-dependent enzyme n=1 Tax=Actinokineospora spheciospongiae TaxID=909613 RepID=UPI000D881B50|nr:aminotransferase class V-fold PLP-dependent enzyme [Actinokineospora spheciospongiae]PWW62613.1 selenocysteine lyase/cysteine desulfurase [Actinokineospora spheciospongiae]
MEPVDLDTALTALDPDGWDAARVLADTPGARGQVFLDSAGSSLPPTPVLDTVVGHLRREAEVGGYRAAAERADDLAEGYAVFAELLGCAPDEVAFTDSATRSWLAAVDAVPLAEGDRVLVTEAEYAGNAVPLLNLAAKAGATVEPVPSGPDGTVDLDALTRLLDERVRLVSLVHVPTNGGLVNPVREVADAAHAVGALVLLDACQSLGQLPLDVGALGVDLLSGTGRKWLRGPRGTGVLVVPAHVRERLSPRLVDLHSGSWVAPGEIELRRDARVFELWECSIADRLGLIAAARYALDLGPDAIAAAVGARAEHLRAGLSALPGVEVRDQGTRRCGIVTFTVEGVAAEAVRDALRGQGITVTVSGRSSTRLDMTRRGLEQVVRASPHYFVGRSQLDTAVAAVRTIR